MRKRAVSIVIVVLGLMAGAAPASAGPADYTTDCTQVTDSIYRLYTAYFEREPDVGGWAYWNQVYGADGGANLDVISDSFTQSEEFRLRYGELSDDDFVALVYSNVLGRQPDTGGFDHWRQALAGGLGRGSLMIAFSESEEYVRLTGTTPPQAGYLMSYDPSFRYQCGTTFGGTAGIYDVPDPGTATYVDILLVNADTTQGSVVSGSLLFAGYGQALFTSLVLQPQQYIHLYNVPIPPESHQVLLTRSLTDVQWSLVFHDEPHSSDRPGWTGTNWIQP